MPCVDGTPSWPTALAFSPAANTVLHCQARFSLAFDLGREWNSAAQSCPKFQIWDRTKKKKLVC
jgi:hypothetical protein